MLATRSRSLHLLTVAALVAAPVVTTSVAVAAPGGSGTAKIRICHRTNAVTNPYVSIEVAQSSVDGNGGNDKGQGDHYLNHLGPVWTSSTPKGADWGDIIPPIPGVHDGRNWTVQGQAIWSAGCRPVDVTDLDDDGTPDIADTDSDNDQIPDAVDPDDDADGTPDATDPDESTATDTDGDRVPDSTDSDDDGDGLVDSADCVDEECLTVVTPPKDDQTDTDGDGVTNQTDRDDDGDGTPDATDPDEDGDTIPDASDPDDDGDRVPDVEDPDSAVVVDDVPDTDGDTVPDVTDRDDDGDGVPDRTDRDADGDGRPDVKVQTLTSDPLPATIAAGEETVLWREQPLTVLGVRAEARVTCRSAARAKPAGDVGADELRDRLCAVKRSGGKTRITVAEGAPTVVTVRFSAPARGEFEALSETRVYRVLG